MRNADVPVVVEKTIHPMISRLNKGGISDGVAFLSDFMKVVENLSFKYKAAEKLEFKQCLTPDHFDLLDDCFEKAFNIDNTSELVQSYTTFRMNFLTDEEICDFEDMKAKPAPEEGSTIAAAAGSGAQSTTARYRSTMNDSRVVDENDVGSAQRPAGPA